MHLLSEIAQSNLTTNNAKLGVYYGSLSKNVILKNLREFFSTSFPGSSRDGRVSYLLFSIQLKRDIMPSK